MSVETTSIIVCDACGARVVGRVSNRTSDGMRSYSDAKRQARAAGWLEQLRYGRSVHLCAACADKPPVKVVRERSLFFMCKVMVEQLNGSLACTGGSMIAPNQAQRKAESTSEFLKGAYVQVWRGKKCLASAGTPGRVANTFIG